MSVRLNRKTNSLLRTIDNKPNPRQWESKAEDRNTHEQSPPPQITSPAHTNDSPISSEDEIHPEPVAIYNGIETISDDDLPSSPPEDPKKPPQRTAPRRNKARTNEVQVLRSSGKKVEHHRNCTSSSDALRDGSLKRKREAASPAIPPPDVAEKEDSPAGLFGEEFENPSQRSRKTYSSSQSRPIVNMHGPAPLTQAKTMVSGKKKGQDGFVKPPMDTGVRGRVPPLSKFQKPPIPAIEPTAKAVFKKPGNANSAGHGSVSSTSTPLSSSQSQAPLKARATSFSFSDSGSDLSSPLGSSILGESQEYQNLHSAELGIGSPPTRSSPQLRSSSKSPLSPTKAKCPMCKAIVDRAFLESFTPAGRRMRSREALRFCEAHNERSAQNRWGDAQYPVIDWDVLDDRLAALDYVVEEIIEKRRPSTYRQELEKKLASHKGRHFLRDTEAGSSRDSTPGYYGSKGARRMMEYILNTFGRKLRKESSRDSIFGAVGISGFVQIVLIPEVACCLVMEDMEMEEEQARAILKESAEMGELVNAEEEEEVVLVEEDDDDGGAGWAQSFVDEVVSSDELSDVDVDVVETIDTARRKGSKAKKDIIDIS